MSATEDHEGLFGRDGRGIEGGVGYVGFERGEVAGGVQTCGFVFGGGYEVGSVEGELEVGYLHSIFVGGGVVEALAGLEVCGLLVWLAWKGGK